jgi:hypothetical protein
MTVIVGLSRDGDAHHNTDHPAAAIVPPVAAAVAGTAGAARLDHLTGRAIEIANTYATASTREAGVSD